MQAGGQEFDSPHLHHVAASLMACRIFVPKIRLRFYRLPLLFPTKAKPLQEPCAVHGFDLYALYGRFLRPLIHIKEDIMGLDELRLCLFYMEVIQ